MIAQITMHVEPVEVDGQHFVDVSMNDHKPKRHGPFASADVAKSKADQLIKYWHTPTTNPPADDVVVLHGTPTKLDSDAGRKFVTDATRAAEGLIDDKTLQEIYEISPENWENITKNVALGRAIRDAGRARVRSGQAAREAAQQHFTKAPTILDSIMSNERASPRHRIEAAKEIRQVAIGSDGAESTPADASEKFTIIFNLGADTERIEKTITPRPLLPANEDKLDADT